MSSSAIIIDGTQKPEEIKFSLESQQGTAPFVDDIFHFIEQWYHSDDEIEVQTSGSTSGQPQLLKVKKEWMKKSASLTKKTFGLSEGATALLCLPVNFIAGKMMIVRALENKWKLTVISATSHVPEQFRTEFNFAAFTPMQLQVWNAEERMWLEKIDTIIVGGGAISRDLEKELSHLKTVIYATYGMTETLTHVAIRRVGNEWYHPLAGIRIQTDERSALLIQAAHLDNSSFQTNDLVEMNECNEFRIIGRADNVINSGGIKLFPELIESKMAHLVEGAFYISSIADEVLGEQLVLIAEECSNPEQLMTELRKVLGKYEVPKKIIVRPISRTHSGKVIRKK